MFVALAGRSAGAYEPVHPARPAQDAQGHLGTRKEMHHVRALILALLEAI
jgi:hypothetical protein